MSKKAVSKKVVALLISAAMAKLDKDNEYRCLWLDLKKLTKKINRGVWDNPFIDCEFSDIVNKKNDAIDEQNKLNSKEYDRIKLAIDAKERKVIFALVGGEDKFFASNHPARSAGIENGFEAEDISSIEEINLNWLRNYHKR